MFKFIKKYAETMDDISIYPVVSLVIFFGFFVGMLWFVKQMKSADAEQAGRLPLDS